MKQTWPADFDHTGVKYIPRPVRFYIVARLARDKRKIEMQLNRKEATIVRDALNVHLAELDLMEAGSK